ncbi:MAG: PEP-CTERM sorting domain-containing protein, partial [candidate division Zixibacteria bacterium]|nr:PEP-CTERM sorting domain-containing protein [candidate division Zixibacteria bacterium]
MPVSAGIYVFEPTPYDLGDLRHDNAWEWGLDFSGGWYFEEVVLTFKNIRNSNDAPNILFIRLLDDVTVGTTKYWDSPDVESDYFACQGVLIDAWTDDVPGNPSVVDLTYTFSTEGLLGHWSNFVANDGMVGFGFDPDCHFDNDGIELTVTGAIPEPGTMMLFALGMVSGVAAYRKKKK